MSDSPRRFGWLDAALLFLLWVLVLKACQAVVWVSALEAMGLGFASSVQPQNVVHASPTNTATWWAAASESNPLIAHTKRTMLIVLCLALACVLLAIGRLLTAHSHGKRGDGTENKDHATEDHER